MISSNRRRRFVEIQLLVADSGPSGPRIETSFNIGPRRGLSTYISRVYKTLGIYGVEKVDTLSSALETMRQMVKFFWRQPKNLTIWRIVSRAELSVSTFL